MPVKSSSRKAKPKFKVGDTVPVVRFNNGREPQAAIVIYIEQSDEDETYFRYRIRLLDPDENGRVVETQ